MGSMLVNGFLQTGALRDDQVAVATRTRSKLGELSEQWPGVHLPANNGDVAKRSDLLFICVKPVEVRDILLEIEPFCAPERTHIISIAGRISLDHIRGVFGGKASKVIPSLTAEVREGLSLVCHNGQVDDESGRFLEELLGKIGGVMRVPEEKIEIASEFTSCGPGLIAAIFREFVEAGVGMGGFSREEVQAMVLPTVFGTAKLMLEKGMGFDETVRRVATPGGITEEGVKVLYKGLPPVFEELLVRSMEKRALVGERIDRQFDEG